MPLNSRLTPIYEPLRYGEIKRSVLDNEKAKLELDWTVQHTLRKGLEETIKAYQKGMMTSDEKGESEYGEQFGYKNYYV